MNAGRFVRFAFVGALGFVVDVAALYTAFALGLGLYLGRIASYLVAATFTWAANRWFTFHSMQAPSAGEWLRFLTANAGGGFVNYLCYVLLVMTGPSFLANPVIAVAAGSLAGLIFNYAASERFVFGRRSTTGERQG
ncbi:MAG: GtrA family protein [Erythrobacter sp.]|jgi:putative flippase GtrA|nr:GtrA family protein [Erythrobacter sp.]